MSLIFSAASALLGLSACVAISGQDDMALKDNALEENSPQAFVLSDLAFMAGCWEGQLGEDVKIRETFTPAGGNTMFGNSQIFGATGTNFFEFIALEQTPDGVVYRPYPRGQAGAVFPLVSLSGGEAVFENAENDFPQRIAYRLTDEGQLVARIETITGERRQQFGMTAVPCGEEEHQRALSR